MTSLHDADSSLERGYTMLYDDALYIQNTFYSVRKKLKDLKGTFAMTLIKQVPLAVGLAIAVGIAAR